METDTARSGRRSGRAARREARSRAVTKPPLPALARAIPVYEVLNAEGLDLIHEASLDILESVGIEFRDTESLSMWRDAGAEVAEQRVRIPRALLLEQVGKAPSQFTLHARNPEHSVEVGGKNTVFAPNYGSPFVRMADGERRYGTLADLNAFHRLAHAAPALQNVSSVICEPVDIPVTKRHLHITYSAIRNSDKTFMGPVTAPERARDAIEMLRILFGGEDPTARCALISLINCNSPLVWDETMLGALKVYTRAGQACLISPFVMGGANTPASPVATVAQLNAEALAGIAFAQLCRPGAPCVYGHFMATVSMKSGAPMAGTPELALMNFMIGQLARRYDVPWRSSGMLAGSKILDAQAAYEAAFNMLPILFAGANFVLHSAGWTEGGLTANLAKFMLDCEQVEMLHKLGRGPQFEDFGEALQAIKDIGPGGHFLGTDHTRANFQNAFFMPELADNNSFEQWLAEGSKDAPTRALEAAAKTLEQFDVPPLDPATDEALQAFIRQRENELPDGSE